MCLGSPITWTSTLVGTSTWPACSFCLCCFWQIMRRLWSLHLSGIPHHKDSTIVGMSTWPAWSFCLCCFWQAARHLWSLHMSRIPHHMDLHPGRNVYLTSWFILSVVFDRPWGVFGPYICPGSPITRIPQWQECLPDQLGHSVCVGFDRLWDICSPYMCPGSPITRTSTLVETSTWPAGSFCLLFLTGS